MPLMRRLSRSKQKKLPRPIAARTSTPSRPPAPAPPGSADRRSPGEKRTYHESTVEWWAESVQRWESEQLARARQKSPLRRPQFSTDSGIPIPDVLTPADRKSEPAEALGLPGQFPFTRGIH